MDLAFAGQGGKVHGNWPLEDDTDFGAREALEGFLGDLAANNTFAVKEGQLPADENVYVVSRLDLIYAGTPLKAASNYFEIVDGKLVEKLP